MNTSGKLRAQIFKKSMLNLKIVFFSVLDHIWCTLILVYTPGAANQSSPYSRPNTDTRQNKSNTSTTFYYILCNALSHSCKSPECMGVHWRIEYLGQDILTLC